MNLFISAHRVVIVPSYRGALLTTWSAHHAVSPVCQISSSGSFVYQFGAVASPKEETRLKLANGVHSSTAFGPSLAALELWRNL